MTSDKHYVWYLAGAREWQSYEYMLYPGMGDGFLYGYGNGYMYGYENGHDYHHRYKY